MHVFFNICMFENMGYYIQLYARSCNNMRNRPINGYSCNEESQNEIEMEKKPKAYGIKSIISKLTYMDKYI